MSGDARVRADYVKISFGVAVVAGAALGVIASQVEPGFPTFLPPYFRWLGGGLALCGFLSLAPFVKTFATTRPSTPARPRWAAILRTRALGVMLVLQGAAYMTTSLRLQLALLALSALVVVASEITILTRWFRSRS